MTKTQKVLDALYSEDLTGKQLRARYGVANPRRVIHYLRSQGYNIATIQTVDTKGRVKNKYTTLV